MMQIIGANGQALSEDDSQAIILLSGYQRGSVGADAVIGAASTLNLSPQVRARLQNLVASRGLPAPAAQPALVEQVGARLAPTTMGPIREIVQGLVSNSIAAGASATIQFSASMLFRPTRLMIGPSYASLFVVEDLRVSADSLFLSSGAVPGEVFLPGAVGASALKRRTAQPGTQVSITVTNVDGVAHVFRAALFGEASDATNCQ